MTQGFEELSKRLRRGSSSRMSLSCGMKPRTASMVSRPARALSWPAAFGWSTTIFCKIDTKMRDDCLSVCSRVATTSDCYRRCLPPSLAEEFEPVAGRMLGNFPQAYSHVGLINSALSLDQYESSRKEQAAPRAIRGRAQAKRSPPRKRHRRKAT